MGIGEESSWSQSETEDEYNTLTTKDYVSHPVFIGELGEYTVTQTSCGLWSSLAVVTKVGNPDALAPSIISSVLSAATPSASSTPSIASSSDEAWGGGAGLDPSFVSFATAAATAANESLPKGVLLGTDEGSPYVSSTRLGDESLMDPVMLSQESLMDSGLALPSLSLSSLSGDDGGSDGRDSGVAGSGGIGEGELNENEMGGDDKGILTKNKFFSKL